MGEGFRLWQYVLLVIVLLFGFVVIYDVHYSYSGPVIDPVSKSVLVDVNAKSFPYPLHADEFTHLASAQYIISTGSIPSVNPYLQTNKYLDLESGYHTFIASFFVLTGLNHVLAYQYLAGIMVILSMLALFLLVYVLSKNYWIALLSSLFLVFVKSNINITGLWFALPITFSLFLIFASLAAYFSNMRLVAGFLFVISLCTYPVSSIIILSVVFLNEITFFVKDKKHQLVKKHFTKHSHRAYLWILFAVLVVILGILAFFVFHVDFFSNQIIFKYGWTMYFEHTYMPWEMYSYLLCIMALLGTVFIFVKGISKTFLLMPSILCVPILMYVFWRFSIFIPYQRAYLLFLISLAPLAAIGTYYFTEYAATFFKKLLAVYNVHFRSSNKEAISGIHVSILIIFTLFLTIFAMHDYYTINDSRFKLVYYIDDQNYAALNWLKSNYDSSDTVMADAFAAFTIYPVSGLQTVAVPSSNLAVGNISSLIDFYYKISNCDQRLDILKMSKPKLLLSRNIINCNYLKEVYGRTEDDKNNGVHIYEVIY